MVAPSNEAAEPAGPTGVGRLASVSIDCAEPAPMAAVARAVALGARAADQQAGPGVWHVLLDPAGHPFCLSTVTVD